jgi:hypothetical protein
MGGEIVQGRGAYSHADHCALMHRTELKCWIETLRAT